MAPTLTHDGALAQLRIMSDEANAQTADYQALQNRYSRVTQFMQQQSLPVTEARLLTSAEPSLSKSAPKSSVIMMLSSIGGLVVGVLLAFGERWPITESVGPARFGISDFPSQEPCLS